LKVVDVKKELYINLGDAFYLIIQTHEGTSSIRIKERPKSTLTSSLRPLWSPGQISADPEPPEYIGGTAWSDSKVTKQLI
jgi:hypothetical protein